VCSLLVVLRVDEIIGNGEVGRLGLSSALSAIVLLRGGRTSTGRRTSRQIVVPITRLGEVGLRVGRATLLSGGGVESLVSVLRRLALGAEGRLRLGLTVGGVGIVRHESALLLNAQSLSERLVGSL
ncbi:hypothetical protein PFISCL1PPCAC_24450, partial [Pristionchus fissidentatus]